VSEADAARSAWAGEKPSWPQACASFYGGVVALMIGGVQPLVFGALVGAGRIGLADLGRIATFESLGLAAGSSLGPALLRRANARAIGFAASLAIVVGSAAMPAARTALALLALRGAIGVAEGALLSLTIGVIARAPEPERWSGAFLGIQTLSQSVGAWALPTLLAPALGANAGFVLLGGLAAVACATSLFTAQEVPVARSPHEAPAGRIPVVAWLALSFILISLASSSAIWSYLERLGNARGLAATFIGGAAAASLVAQALGSFIAMGIGPRVRWLTAVCASALAQLASMAAFQRSSSGSAFLLAAIAFGFFWLFAMPYQVRALVELDPSRASARLIASAQILGGAIGPLAASTLVSGSGLAGVLWFGAAATVTAVALAAGTRWMASTANRP
jgi:predicted MFS family arabinose efflux permease